MSEQHPLGDDDSIVTDNNEPPKKKLEDGFKPMLYTETLQEIFNFGELDLGTNRNGMATADQRQLLLDDLKDDADGMWLLVTSLLGVSVMLGFIMALNGIPTMALLIGAGVILGPLLLYAYLRQTKTRKDVDDLRVRSTYGQPTIQYRRFSDGGRYVLTVGDVSLPITMQQAHALSEYHVGPLRVHYTENSKLILSAETDYSIDMEKLKNEDLDTIEIIEDDEAVTINRQLHQ